MKKEIEEKLKEAKKYAKKNYSQSPKLMDGTSKYKIKGVDGYLLLDNINEDGSVPVLLYRNKWREDRVSLDFILEQVKKNSLPPKATISKLDLTSTRIDLSIHPEYLDEILAKTAEDAICVCDYCQLVFKVRPFICKCRANTFLRDIEKVS